ncbi:MAG: alpha-glucuronidase [Clostridia bacterium]|nr:alpha-glucuronidase [Clostridia bacterium]
MNKTWESRLAWLKALKTPVPAELNNPLEVADFEAKTYLNFEKTGRSVCFKTYPAMKESYAIETAGDGYIISGGQPGVLYGVYALMRALEAGEKLPSGVQKPYYPLRMIDCWDNMDGSVERGYAGRSIWFEENRFDYDPARIRQLGRMLASVGINVLCINNVNVHQPAQHLLDNLLPQVEQIAALLRPFGVRLMLSIDFSLPLQNGVETADPEDPAVADWWKKRAREVWGAIPDLAGFLVKADSEHRPGPNAYGRTHAQGANMLARAIAPFGGVLVWRAFVYNCMQDWRDTNTDRPRAAYDLYQPLDGAFDENVILQVKYGPYDFQVREPVSPLLLGMEKTRLAVEFQLAQEYTGHQIDLFAMPPLWRDIFDQMGKERVRAIAAVSNLGRDGNWTGHPFAALNLFAYGIFAWKPDASPQQVIRAWVRNTYNLSEQDEEQLIDLLLASRGVYEKYTAPLGLCWMVRPEGHYGPSPYGYEFQAWGTYNRADRNAVGVDRTERGTGYVAQYPPKWKKLYENPHTCPDELLLFFHRLPYDFVMKDGRTLIQRIYDDHFEGVVAAETMAETLKALPLPEEDRREALERMDLQVQNAREWRDVINTFFRRFSGVDDVHGRKIYD